MKANELMIGDWVCYNVPNKYYTKVEEIRCTSDGEEYYIRCHRDSKDTYLEQLKHEDFSVDILHPIPLTPEILEKIGFEKWDDGWYIYDYETTGIEIAWVGTILKISGEYVNLELPSVMYVHQLQHALRLCGIEIEIKLRDDY